MPAFYFDWLYTNQNRENTIKAIDASVTILSLAVGIGELRIVAAAGRGIFIAKTSLGIFKSAVNLGLLNDRIHPVRLRLHLSRSIISRLCLRFSPR
jgi:hypothetical protein